MFQKLLVKLIYISLVKEVRFTALVIYGAGGAPWPLPDAQPAPDGRQWGRLQLCCPLAGLWVVWGWHWAPAALLAVTDQLPLS